MAHYAFLDKNNIVTEVIVGIDETELIEGKDPETWYGEFRGQVCKRTSYNTQAGVYYDIETGEPHEDQSKAFRGNYAGIGYEYREDLDAFIPAKPFDSWILNENTYLWEAPVPYPTDGEMYTWDEETTNWVAVEQP